MQQHRQHVYLEESTNDAFQLETGYAWTQRDRLVRELVAGKFVIALDGARNKRGEIEIVEQVSARANVPLRVSGPCFYEQVQYAKEDVGEPQCEIGMVDKDSIRQEAVRLGLLLKSHRPLKNQSMLRC